MRIPSYKARTSLAAYMQHPTPVGGRAMEGAARHDGAQSACDRLQERLRKAVSYLNVPFLACACHPRARGMRCVPGCFQFYWAVSVEYPHLVATQSASSKQFIGDQSAMIQRLVDDESTRA